MNFHQPLGQFHYGRKGLKRNLEITEETWLEGCFFNKISRCEKSNIFSVNIYSIGNPALSLSKNAEIFNHFAHGGKFSDSFYAAIIKLLPKSENAIAVQDFNPISLMNIDAKIFAH